MNRSCWSFCVAVLCLLIVPVYAAAALVPGPFNSGVGPSCAGCLVFDTDTGKEWLSPTLTIDTSYDDVDAGTFGGLTTVHGFSIATQGEVAALLTAQGFNIIPPIVYDEAHLDEAQAFLAAFGETFEDFAVSGQHGIQGITQTPSTTTGFNWEGFVKISVNFTTKLDERGGGGVNGRSPAGDNVNADSGAWLLRIPEPASSLLLLLGMAAMARHRRRPTATTRSVDTHR